MKLGASTAVLHDKPPTEILAVPREIGQFTGNGIAPTSLNRNGNTLHPDPEVRAEHGQDVRDGSVFPSRASLETVARIPEVGSLPRNAGFEHDLPHVLLLDRASHSALNGGTTITIEKD